MTAIEVQSLCKSYKTRLAVDHLTLSIEEGELFSLLGVNGAGKSTTIKMLSCLSTPTAGDARILGRSIVKEPQRVKELIGISPQESAVAPNLSVRENLEFVARLYGQSREQARRAAEESIAAFHMEQIAHDRAKVLSGGWQRRLSIALALISKPKVLFLDEPTLGLDVLARRELWKTVESLHGSVTIILTTHYMEEAQALSDRIGILSGGRLTAVGTAEALMRQTNTATFEDCFLALVGEGGLDR